eukprot:6473055-Amphidinium_carterae.1
MEDMIPAFSMAGKSVAKWPPQDCEGGQGEQGASEKGEKAGPKKEKKMKKKDLWEGKAMQA